MRTRRRGTYTPTLKGRYDFADPRFGREIVILKEMFPWQNREAGDRIFKIQFRHSNDYLYVPERDIEFGH